MSIETGKVIFLLYLRLSQNSEKTLFKRLGNQMSFPNEVKAPLIRFIFAHKKTISPHPNQYVAQFMENAKVHI